MAVLEVQEGGGGATYATLTLALAAANASDTITMIGTWTNPLDDEAVTADTSLTINCDSDSHNPGHVNTGSATHFRLYNTDGADGGHCLTVNTSGCIIDGLDICQRGTGESDECIRMANDGGTLTVKNTILWADANVSDQDGIYAGTISCTINLENVIAYGFGRAGFHPQAFTDNPNTQTWNLNCCTAWNCGRYADEAQGGGIDIDRTGNPNVTYNINCFRCVFVENDSQLSKDYNSYDSGSTATANWDIHNSIDSDNSIASRDGAAVGCLASRAAFDSDQGVGSYVLFEDITTADYDLRLLDLGNAKNNAQDMDATGTGAGLTAGDDIVGTSRPQNTNYDCGAFEIVAAGGEEYDEAIEGIFSMAGESLRKYIAKRFLSNMD